MKTLVASMAVATALALAAVASAGYFDVINGAGIGSAANGQDQIVVGTPEPGLVLLLGFALIGMFVYQRRMQLQPRAIRVD